MTSASTRREPLVWTELDYKELRALAWLATHRSALMTEAGHERLRELHERRAEAQEQHDEEWMARWAPTVTPGRIRKLERKLERGENLTGDEGNQWAAAVTLSEPPEPPEHVIIDEGEEWPPDPPSHAAWDAWYARPISESLFPRHAPIVVIPTRIRRGSPGRRTPRARRTIRTSRGSPARQSDDPDLEPACPRCGSGVVVFGGVVTCAACWASTVLELEERAV